MKISDPFPKDIQQKFIDVVYEEMARHDFKIDKWVHEARKKITKSGDGNLIFYFHRNKEGSYIVNYLDDMYRDDMVGYLPDVCFEDEDSIFVIPKDMRDSKINWEEK